MIRPCILSLACGLVLFAGPPHEIEGRVLDARTGAPIARARVTVTFFQPGGEPVPVMLLTDEGGAFDLKNAPEWNYHVTCERSGYLSANQPGQGLPGSSSQDAKAAPLIVRLIPHGVIEGSVVDERGAPVPFANVQVFRQTIMEGHRQPQVASDNAADDTGSFRIFGLDAGRYWVGVTVPANGSQRAKFAHPPVFYPNSLDINGAELMDLEPGQERHLRIRLPEPVPAREIRGQVVPAGESVNVQLRPADATLSNQSLSLRNDWDEKTKTFKISGVTAGVYVLEANTNVEDQYLRAGMTVTVGNRDITGIRLEPRAPPEVFGTLGVEGTEKPAYSIIELRSRHGRYRAQYDADGKFKFNGLPEDTYRLVASPDGPAYLRSAWQGSRDVLRDGLAVSTESSPEPLEIVLGGPGANVEGAIALPDSGRPVNVVVALLRHAGNEMVMEKEALANRPLPAGAVLSVSGVPDIQRGNRFTIQGVAPGDYVVYCWPADSQVPYADSDFIERYGSFGKAITVRGAEKISVNLDRLLPRIDP